MIRIKCVNGGCPKKSFNWDESKHIQQDGSTAQPFEKGAARVIAVCPHCFTENTVWVKHAAKPDKPTRTMK